MEDESSVSDSALKDLATLFLVQRSETAESENETELFEWFLSLKESISNSAKHPMIQNFGASEFGGRKTKMCLMLRECMLTQRWPEAASVMTELVQEVHNTGQSIMKCGLEIFMNGPQAYKRFLDYFVGQLSLQPEVYAKEVHMEEALHLMSQGFLKEAVDKMKSVPARTLLCRSIPNADTVNIQFEAFQGLLCYMDFATARYKMHLESEQTSTYGDTLMDNSVSANDYENQMQFAATKAVDHFKNLPETPGNWDNFIPKHVELLEYLGRSSECLEVIEKFASKNPDNPNSLRIRYEYHKRIESDISVQIAALEQFCQAVPTDELCLELCSMHRKYQPEEYNVRAPRLLFDLLDYGVWNEDAVAWESLASCLRHIALHDSEAGRKAVVQCWEVRSDWWPSYHFRTTSVTSQADTKLLTAKACVAVVLLGANNAYSTLVTRTMENVTREDRKAKKAFKAFIRDCNESVSDWKALD